MAAVLSGVALLWIKVCRKRNLAIGHRCVCGGWILYAFVCAISHQAWWDGWLILMMMMMMMDTCCRAVACHLTLSYYQLFSSFCGEWKLLPLPLHFFCSSLGFGVTFVVVMHTRAFTEHVLLHWTSCSMVGLERVCSCLLLGLNQAHHYAE